MTSINLFNLSAIQFLYLWSRGDFTCHIGFSWRSRLVTFMKCLMQHWAQHTPSINGSHDRYGVVHLMPHRCEALPNDLLCLRNVVGNDPTWILSPGFQGKVCISLLFREPLFFLPGALGPRMGTEWLQMTWARPEVWSQAQESAAEPSWPAGAGVRNNHLLGYATDSL